ncbi:VPLPA-CTERM sorting domain-containing protein [Rubrimonas cliftonensis]|uniref:VPLPA-CTERM protein sorting domain-containing protein n=1 Tax=Rubrimonas cliftonensis TaxID=89524 RepID=A0A1H3XEV6_9RHOB|nr:VPLPA-CTERM sorting domain-containing protein [Rubrimonas cliftonensis]SDZ97760.1 VPLPA-CTERM protein sorting domain-containing protein [Rubrimonas cliftonensis]
MNVRFLAAGILLSGFAAAPVSAATFSFADGSVSVRVVEKSDNISVFGDVFQDGFDGFTDGTGIVEEFPDTPIASDEVISLAFTLFGTSDPVFGEAVGLYEGAAGFEFFNESDMVGSVTFEVEWYLEAMTQIELTSDAGSAFAGLSIIQNGSLLDRSVSVEDLGTSTEKMALRSGEPQDFTFTIAVGAFESEFLDVSLTGGVNALSLGGGDVAPVPLPAAGWMLFAGLGALVAMRRRA